MQSTEADGDSVNESRKVQELLVCSLRRYLAEQPSVLALFIPLFGYDLNRLDLPGSALQVSL